MKLAPGEKKNVTFAIAIRDLASYDMDLEQFAVEEGYYDILAATSSAAEDVFGETRIYLDVKSPYSYSVDTQLKVICEDDALLEAANQAWAAEGWDIGVIQNNYQYSPQKSLREILVYLDAHLRTEEKVAHFIAAFEEKVRTIKKK